MKEIDWKSLGFGFSETNGHIQYVWKDGAWDRGELVKEPYLKMHIGAPSVPVVEAGDWVKAGQLIAKCPEGTLGSAIHASISGKVVSVGNTVEISSSL